MWLSPTISETLTEGAANIDDQRPFDYRAKLSGGWS
jgi:hypothetical protein